jgi:hypothetical protein
MAKSSAVPICDKVPAARARAAERTRRSRKRRRDGLRYRLDLRDGEIESLVRRGLLSPGELDLP